MKDALWDAFLCGDSVNMTHSNKNEISRFGAYGILLQNSAILLTRKKSGPYKGLWDLPGGAIEFAETPEEALKRELLEESLFQSCDLNLRLQLQRWAIMKMMAFPIDSITLE